MDDVNELTEQQPEETLVAESQEPVVDEPAPPIHSRFLFVDVAALRAKQLRRGARVRYESDPGVFLPHKPERVAMEEVRRGLVHYNVPELKVLRAENEA